MSEENKKELKEQYLKKKELEIETQKQDMLSQPALPSNKNLTTSHLSFPDIQEVNQLTDPKSVLLQKFLYNNPFKQTLSAPDVDINMIKDLGKALTLKQNPSNPKQYSVTYSNGTKYEGTILEDKDDVFYGQPIGQGKLWFPNGDIYEGGLGNRVKGIYTYKNGTEYEGTFFKFAKSGAGQEKYPCGSVFKGNFKGNMKHGVGEFVFENKDVFNGKFIEGKRKGLGTYLFASGESVYGDWKDDHLHGKGRWKGLSGEVVERSFVKSNVSLE